jgi:hypothetical protein
MEERELNCATIELAENWDISGRATANEINCGLRTGKGRSFWRATSSAILGSLMVAGLFVAVAPMPVRADLDEVLRHEHEDNDKGLRAEIAALQAQVASLQSTVSALEDQVNSLQSSNTALQTQLANAKNVLALAPFVSVDPNPQLGVAGPSITFKGANLHIVSGSGSTDDSGTPRGLGNLIIGYDEDPSKIPFLGPPLQPGDRGGSHNLIIGSGHRFRLSAFGGLVTGEGNTISALGASVSGGLSNSARGRLSSVSGGEFNTAGGEGATVSGGFNNTASGAESSVSGGSHNTASGLSASVSGGSSNTASGGDASVTGGFANTASGGGASVLGGGNFLMSGGNTASGFATSILGGLFNTASGDYTVVLGGTRVIDNKANSIAPQPPFP